MTISGRLLPFSTFCLTHSPRTLKPLTGHSSIHTHFAVVVVVVVVVVAVVVLFCFCCFCRRCCLFICLLLFFPEN